MADRPIGPHKNPSTTFFWNDWDNDEALKACSLAAQGLWMRCLCIAARSPEPGVVMIGGFPASRTEIAPRLAAVVGHSLDAVNALIDELLTSGTASLDRRNRIINRRMVKAAALHKKRSEAGKAGAAASVKSRTSLSQSGGQEEAHETAENGKPPSDCNDYENGGLPQQNSSKPPGKQPANPSANGVASSRLQDFPSSKSPLETATESVAVEPGEALDAGPVSGDPQADRYPSIPPFLRRPPSGTARQIPADFQPEPSTREALLNARPDLTDADVDRRHGEFLSWCSEKAVTSHNFDATWHSFMVKTHVQQTNGQGAGPKRSPALAAAAAFAAGLGGAGNRGSGGGGT